MPSAVDIGEVILNAIHASRLVYPVETQLASNVLAITDSARLDTIIGHLVQNAIEASTDGAPIKISSKRVGDQIAISIIDKGMGMTESFIADELFKPFVSTKPTGFGIGAYEARALALSMGGTLKVYSRPSKGTTFTLLLPAATTGGIHSSHQEAA